MSHTINFGIDLGTTNSSIAVCKDGTVEVFKNPAGLRQTLPSVVAFRRERTIIGDKAREYIEKDPQNVVNCFKRKMGTDDKYFIPNRNETFSPVDLSALVLQELQRFIYTGETCSSVVITIPAAFDTVQSNATKQAGYQAGFSEVVLLQEPIAASLAFVNKQADDNLGAAKWIVYDLGGGTFDAALISVDGEMKVIDHEGDNFFGGMDFDNLIVDKIIVPKLKATGHFADIERLRSAHNRYNSLYYTLLHKAEETKISLSNHDSADIEFEAEDDGGTEREFFFTVQRAEFEALIVDHIRRSIAIVQELLDRNGLSAGEIKEIILIGGSTCIPLVRRALPGELGIPVNCSIDPTTAVVVGAACYAATKTAETKNETAAAAAHSARFYVRTGYAKYTKSMDEHFSAVITPAPSSGELYRIVRKDGGFDTGFCLLTNKIGLRLPLLPRTVNRFELTLYDRRQRRIPVLTPDIEIVQGQFSVQGQPLPNDICIEVDDVENGSTLLDVVFEKNSILPLRKTIVKTVSRTMKVASDDRLLINVVEGSRYSSPQSCVPVGVIEIKAKTLEIVPVKGCDIELCFEMNESRDLTVSAYIAGIDYETSRVFSPQEHTVHIPRVVEELEFLLKNVKFALREALQKEFYEESAMLRKWELEIDELITKARLLDDDDVTDEKYSIEKQKRKLSVAMDAYTGNRQLLKLNEEYFELKSDIETALQKHENELFRKRFESLTQHENAWLHGSPAVIRTKLRDMRRLNYELEKSNFEWVAHLYFYYMLKDDSEYSDTKRLAQLKEQAQYAIAQQNAPALLTIVNHMYHLLINRDDGKPDLSIHGIGIE
ncbi:MAG: Hsp70 family protein [Tannerella sp.]|jgi:molecular chaperone DnaK|nr:Hsp70 family protein [Tannerella sp.]